MEIRKCRQEEIVAAGEFYDGIVEYLDSHVNYPLWIYKVYPSLDFAREMTKEGSLYICISDERIVAAFSLDNNPDGNYSKCKWKRDLSEDSYMVLHALAIDPEIQRQGLASSIIDFCIEKADSEGYDSIRLDVVPENYPAKRLFEKNGFVYVGDEDLEREITDVPAFSLYELNW